MLETVTVTRKKGKNSGNIRFKHLFSIKALGPARLNRHTQEKVFQHGGKLFDGKMHGAGPRRGIEGLRRCQKPSRHGQGVSTGNACRAGQYWNNSD